MTRSEIRSLILTNTGNRTDKTDVANAAIDLAMTRLGQLHDWQDARIDVELPIVAGDSSIILPDGTRKIIEMRLINGVLSYDMQLLDKAAVVRMAPNAPAQPQGYPKAGYEQQDGLGNDAIFFIPTSNGTYAIHLTIQQYPSIAPDGTAEASVNDLDEIVVAYGTAYVFRSVGSYELAVYWDSEFAKGAKEAIRADAPNTRHVAEQHPGRAVVSGDPVNDPFVQSWPPR